MYGVNWCSSLAELQKIVCWAVNVLAQQKLPGDLGYGSKCIQRLRSLAYVAITPAPKDGVAGCSGIARLPVL